MDKRTLSDRRKKPTPFISKHSFQRGRRKTIRRQQDRGKHRFVDQYGVKLWVSVLLLLLLTALDAFLTIASVENGMAIEVNPIMAFYLEHGNVTFLSIKFFLTGLAVTILCLCKNFSLTKVALASILIIYVLTVSYQLYMVYEYRIM